MIITTTSTIQNAEEIKYLEIVSTNIVVGTNFFSDFAASFTDVFGGNSSTYEGKLRGIYKQAMSDLTHKAQKLGANAIIGLQIDFDEVSGKGKSMFMVSAIGTAAIVKMNESISKDIEKNKEVFISKDDVNREIKKLYYKSRFESFYPTETDIKTIFSEGITGFEKEVYELYLNINKYYYSNEKLEATKNCSDLLEYLLLNMPYEEACDLVYSEINNNNNISSIKYLIQKTSLFCPSKILELINEGNYKIAINLLDLDKNEYTRDDCNIMKLIIEKLDNLPDIGSIQIVKGGLLSKDKEKYICPNGHANDLEDEFCVTCGMNIKGLTQEDINIIQDFKKKVETIDNLLGSN